MSSRAKVPDDGEAKRERVRDLIQRAYHRGLLGHEVRAELDREVFKEGTAAGDVRPPVPGQKKLPCDDGSSSQDGPDEDVRTQEVRRQKVIVGELAAVAARLADAFRVSRPAREDIAQDAIAKVLGVIDRGPLKLDDEPDTARCEMIAYLKWAVRSAYVDHIRKVAARAVRLAEYTDEIELPRTVEGGESAETTFFSTVDASMATALTEGFASSMDDAVEQAERLATAMHDMVGTKELVSLILHKAFAVPADIVADMTSSSTDSVRAACGAAKVKLRKPLAKRSFLMRLRADTD